MIVLDTNVVSELMKSAPEPAVMAWIDAIPGATLFLSAVTQAEILYGVALVPEGKRREGLALAARTAFDTYFRGRILPFDSEAAEAFAELAAGRRRAGRPISQADAQIAQSHGRAVRCSPRGTCRTSRGAGLRSSTLGGRHRDSACRPSDRTEDEGLASVRPPRPAPIR